MYFWSSEVFWGPVTFFHEVLSGCIAFHLFSGRINAQLKFTNRKQIRTNITWRNNAFFFKAMALIVIILTTPYVCVCVCVSLGAVPCLAEPMATTVQVTTILLVCCVSLGAGSFFGRDDGYDKASCPPLPYCYHYCHSPCDVHRWVELWNMAPSVAVVKKTVGPCVTVTWWLPLLTGTQQLSTTQICGACIRKARSLGGVWVWVFV